MYVLEYDEYLENDKESRKKKRGDILEGNISIEQVTFSQKVDEDISPLSRYIFKFSHIEAIIKVDQIIDEYSLYAFSSLSDDIILIEFENAVNYIIGDRVFVIGSLELSNIT